MKLTHSLLIGGTLLIGGLAFISPLGRHSRAHSESTSVSIPAGFPVESLRNSNKSQKVRGYAPIVSPPIVAGDSAELAVRDEDDVLGVEINGESRAYPVIMLSTRARHVVNDTLGGRPIAATWCGMTQSLVVFARDVPGKTLTLFVSGRLIHQNVVISDVETGSEWPQLSGEAVTGPFQGTRLELVPSVWTNWKTWRTKHPETTVLNFLHTPVGYHHDQEYSNATLEQKDFSAFQWGLARSGKTLSWPFAELSREPIVNDSFMGLSLLLIFDTSKSTPTVFERRLDDSELTFRQDASGLTDHQTGTTWDPITGRAIRGALAGRRLNPIAGAFSQISSWQAFHPTSDVRTAKAR